MSMSGKTDPVLSKIRISTWRDLTLSVYGLSCILSDDHLKVWITPNLMPHCRYVHFSLFLL